MDQYQQARQLRDKGMLFREIAIEMKISSTMARNYALGISSQKRPNANSRENRPYLCKNRNERKYQCQRGIDHRGVHLANDNKGRLIYW
jgi:hypothetical protein